MKTLKKIIILALVLILACGCGSQENNDTDDKVIRVGATAVPHAMILKDVVKDILAEEGWTLEVVEFSDYVLPNTSLEDGELDANYFQTLAYMEDQNASRGLHLVAAQGVHYEPMTLFSKDYKTLEEFSEGDEIAVPNDYDNEVRALTLVASTGLIEYEHKDGDASPLDGITSNPKNIVFQEVEAPLVPNANDDCQGLVINGNYALESGIKDRANVVFVEQLTPEQIEARINYLVVTEGNETSEKTQALIKAITSDKVASYIEENYGSAVIVTFK